MIVPAGEKPDFMSETHEEQRTGHIRSTRVLRYREHGEPGEVLALEEEAVPEPDADEVLLRTLAAPVNPADLGQIAGRYAVLKQFPAGAGIEGLGEVSIAGREVAGVRAGDWVRLPSEPGTWREYVVAKGAGLLRVPNDLPVRQAAMAFVNPPTARRLLGDFVSLRPGEWLVQNAATSAVGRYVIQLARRYGWRTFNVVRDEAGGAAVRKAGGDVVVVEGSDLRVAFREAAGEVRPRLGLNSVGGESALGVLRLLAPGGVLVTFGGMTSEPVRFPTRQLIFDDLSLRGFWLTRWLREAPAVKIGAMYRDLFDLIRDGTLRVPVAGVYPLEGFREALAHAARPGRGGKILFVPAGRPGPR